MELCFSRRRQSRDFLRGRTTLAPGVQLALLEERFEVVEVLEHAVIALVPDRHRARHRAALKHMRPR